VRERPVARLRRPSLTSYDWRLRAPVLCRVIGSPRLAQNSCPPLGRGSGRLSNAPPPRTSVATNKIRKIITPKLVPELLILRKRVIRSYNLAMTSNPFTEVEIVGEVAAGRPTSNEEIESRCIRVDLSSIEISPKATTFALIVRGDSMIGAHILDGDTIVLEHKNPHNRAIVAALVDGQSTLKRYVERKGGPILQAENPKYPNVIPARELVIQGVGLAVFRRL
jgi:SOS-response transcriptional repressor LexA